MNKDLSGICAKAIKTNDRLRSERNIMTIAAKKED